MYLSSTVLVEKSADASICSEWPAMNGHTQTIHTAVRRNPIEDAQYTHSHTQSIDSRWALLHRSTGAFAVHVWVLLCSLPMQRFTYIYTSVVFRMHTINIFLSDCILICVRVSMFHMMFIMRHGSVYASAICMFFPFDNIADVYTHRYTDICIVALNIGLYTPLHYEGKHMNLAHTHTSHTLAAFFVCVHVYRIFCQFFGHTIKRQWIENVKILSHIINVRSQIYFMTAVLCRLRHWAFKSDCSDSSA